MSDNVAEVKAILSHPRMGLTARPHNIPSRQVRPCGTALAAMPVPYCFTFMQRTQMTSDICTQELTQFSGFIYVTRLLSLCSHLARQG